ncbi:MAG: phytanoyl-CoA dioxygenase family protein [Candidatus Binatia bacterium]|nr:phytanoyl-CoA dioxygenase family protein [Candidatus Binatia bacterium]
MKLTPQHLETFRERGFVNVGQIFTDDELATISGEYDRLVTFEAQTLGNETDGVYPYRAMLNFRSATLRTFVNHPEMLGLVAQVIGPDVRFWWDQGINKAPGSGSLIPWHQDNGYHPGGCPEFLTTWLALDDSNLANGGLQVLPGSHKNGAREHVLETVHFYVPGVDDSNAVELPAKAGDTLLFSTLLLHQTVGNQTEDRQRRAWVMQYGRADAKNFTTGEPYDDRPWVLKDGTRVDPPFAERRLDLS